MALTEFESHDAVGLAELVARGEVTPAELVEAAIERIQDRNPAVNAVIHRRFDEARIEAGGRLPDGPLRGVPFLLKDLTSELAGTPMHSGSRFLRDHVPDSDSELVRRFKAAGLVIVGKTNTPEFGIMGVTEPVLFGPARNPWNPEFTTGGSSGGSAAAVAAGIVPIAHGNDGGGSIRIPASCCGVFGFKPTRGRTPLGPDIAESWSGLVVEHCLTRSVRDSAAVLDATHGPDPGAPYFAAPPERAYLDEVERDPGGLRVAFTSDSLFGDSTHPECRAALADTADLLADLGHEVEEVRPKFDKEQLRQAYLRIVAVGTARAVTLAARAAGRRARARDFEQETWLLALIGRATRAPEFQAAIDAMHLAARRIAAFFQRYDVLVTPTLAYPPTRVGELASGPSERASMALLQRLPLRSLLDVALDRLASEKLEATGNTMLFNMTGQPAMSLPLAKSAAGLPLGTQVVGRYGDEATLFRLAGQIERARPWFGQIPPLATRVD